MAKMKLKELEAEVMNPGNLKQEILIKEEGNL